MQARPTEQPEILIIEDEPLIAMYIEDALARSGYRTTGPFETVETAVQAAHRFDGAGALVDLMLDGVDARVVTGILAKRNIPFVIMTGSGAEGITLPDGVDASVLTKPFLAGDLIERVRAVCSR